MYIFSLQHLLDIGSCVWLARPLVSFCCNRLAGLFELDQKLQKYQLPPIKQEHAPSSSHLEDVMETNEDDSVFSENAPAIKQEPGTKAKTPSSATGGGESKGGRRMSVSKERKQSNSATASTPATAASSGEGGGDIPAINITSPEGEPPYYHWCPHHQSVLLQLCCIVQTLAVKCPTAFITIKVLSGKGGVSRESTAKAITPLSQLPLRLVDLPMPKSLNSDLQKKVHGERMIKFCSLETAKITIALKPLCDSYLTYSYNSKSVL